MLRLVDLSLDIYDHAPTFGADPKTGVLPHMGIANMGYNVTQLIVSTHLGTHLDAPFHFFDDGRTVENLDVRRGFGPAWVLDFSHKGPKSEITPADLAPHAAKITPGSRLIFRTGWDKQFPQPHYFSDQPYLGPAGCTWLAERHRGAGYAHYLPGRLRHGPPHPAAAGGARHRRPHRPGAAEGRAGDPVRAAAAHPRPRRLALPRHGHRRRQPG
jgi:putative cyclase